MLLLIGLAPMGAAGAETGEWRHYGGDLGARKYSALDQINAETVKSLEIAWVWDAPDNDILQDIRTKIKGAFIDNFKGTPIMVDGVLYIRTPLGFIEAIDARSGTTRWRYDARPHLATMPESYGFTTRGVAYWRGQGGEERIFATTPDRKLLALDARTGARVPTFGTAGAVDLDATQRRLAASLDTVNYGNQVPLIVGNVVIIGGAVSDGEHRYLRKDDPKAMPIVATGDVRGFDAVTGRHLWTFNTVPQAGEFGVETWEDESWRWAGHTNVWSLMSADAERGLVYLPVSSPTGNYYAGFRKGDNLFGQSIVCLDAKTGRRVWHFQTIRHPIFDYDMTAAPVLVDIVVDGRAIPAVIAINKTGFLYVLDRVTGAPVWPIVERPVPPAFLPGERTAATQPVPSKPPPVAGQGIDATTILNLTPELHAKAKEIVAKFDHGPIFTPASERGTILYPGNSGGPNWPGGAFDPETGLFYITVMNLPIVRGQVPDGTFFGYRTIRPAAMVVEFPIVNPPWAEIVAVDLNRGEIAWRRANGPGPKDHPALAHLKLPDLGYPAKSNALVTKSLLFAATSGRSVYGPPPKREAMRIGAGLDPKRIEALKLDSRAMMRAFDKKTGRTIWEHPIGPSFNDGGAPMTYLWQGRQYLVMPVGGGDQTLHLIAFALPTKP